MEKMNTTQVLELISIIIDAELTSETTLSEFARIAGSDHGENYSVYIPKSSSTSPQGNVMTYVNFFNNSQIIKQGGLASFLKAICHSVNNGPFQDAKTRLSALMVELGVDGGAPSQSVAEVRFQAVEIRFLQAQVVFGSGRTSPFSQSGFDAVTGFHRWVKNIDLDGHVASMFELIELVYRLGARTKQSFSNALSAIQAEAQWNETNYPDRATPWQVLMNDQVFYGVKDLNAPLYEEYQALAALDEPFGQAFDKVYWQMLANAGFLADLGFIEPGTSQDDNKPIYRVPIEFPVIMKQLPVALESLIGFLTAEDMVDTILLVHQRTEQEAPTAELIQMLSTQVFGVAKSHILDKLTPAIDAAIKEGEDLDPGLKVTGDSDTLGGLRRFLNRKK